jgi:predicted nucleic acid-binding protein
VIFDDISAGATVFVDANTFVYAFSQHLQFGAPCRELLDRIDRGEISGVSSSHVLSETAHRLMTLEACSRFGWPFAGIAQRLRRHPAELQQLSAYRQAVDAILQSQIRLLEVRPDLVLSAADIGGQCGILSGDALIVAVMHDMGITDLASNDADFDRVPGITRYVPA